MLNLDLKRHPRVSPRYVVDDMGTPVRPYRVRDTHKRQVIIYTADPAIAQKMAEEYEKQWLRSTRLRRNWQRLMRALRSLFTRRARPRPELAAPSIREQRVTFVDNLCEKARADLAAHRN